MGGVNFQTTSHIEAATQQNMNMKEVCCAICKRGGVALH